MANRFNLNDFVAEHVVCRPASMFAADLEANDATLRREIEGSSVLVIGGAGSIGSSFIKALLPYRPAKLVVVDISENGLVELTRDLRSGGTTYMPDEYLTYTLDFADPIMADIFAEHGGFDIVANFSAHKHVRSEKDRYTVEALINNNIIKARGLLDMLAKRPPRHFFCVSTDKAANPVNVMGASKRVMEDLIMAYKDDFKVTTARFANVAFSAGSLPASFIERLAKRQPLAAPCDVRRYFVTMQESGQICLLACILGHSGEVFFPKLGEDTMRTFSDICLDFLAAHGLEPHLCGSDSEAVDYARRRGENDPYPVVLTRSDTSGEKATEEFTVEGEGTDLSRFEALGVVTSTANRPRAEVESLVAALKALFADRSFTKADVVRVLEDYLPTFRHRETGLSLDSRM